MLPQPINFYDTSTKILFECLLFALEHAFDSRIPITRSSASDVDHWTQLNEIATEICWQLHLRNMSIYDLSKYNWYNPELLSKCIKAKDITELYDYSYDPDSDQDD